ncbi:MAG: HlyC/CorC family transporter [Clostridia bacterium]|nr:HlyC/CorC family transporter [Clostridia bacterium]
MKILPYITIVLMLMLSAFFSGSEIAFNASNKLRLKKNGEAGNKAAALAYRTFEKFTVALSAILIGNNLANIAASSATTLIILDILGALGITGGRGEALGSAIATVLMTVLILIFGEIIPKILSKQHADRVVCWVAYPIRILTVILSPLVLIVQLILRGLRKLWGKDQADDAPTVTEEELSSIIETVEEEGVIDEDLSELMQSTLEFNEITLGEILIPRIDILAYDVQYSFEKLLAIAEDSCYTRIPVYDEKIDNIIGILSLNHFYRALVDANGEPFDIRPLLLEPCFLHKSMKLPQALKTMRENQIHLAIVVDEFGGTMGIVTLEDILEQIVGDIWDESDEIVEEYRQISDNGYDVSGDMGIWDFFDMLEVNAKDFESEYTTVGGWAIEMLDAQPHEGDSFQYKNLYVIVAQMEDLRVTRLTVVVTPVEEDEDSEV